MTTYGVTSAGFVAKPLQTVSDEIDAGLRGILGDSAGTEPDGSIPLNSMAGQLKALVVDGFAAQWDLQQAVYSSFDPNQTTGDSQDAIASITGTIREAASFSTATLVCVGTAGTVLIAGRVVTVTTTLSRFSTNADATISASTAWVALTAYAVGAVVANSGNIYYCITAGTSAGAGGPTTTATDITDGSVHWRYIAAGSAHAVITATAAVTGPIGALAGTLVTIATPVAGWNTVSNPVDAVVGTNIETDSSLRARRDAELAAAGNTTVEAIRANLLKLNEGSQDPAHVPLTAASVFFNDTDAVDANGLPPHSIECLVYGPNTTDADIATVVWNSVGGGTYTYGTTTTTVTDSQGNSQTVRFTRPTAVPIYVVATVYYDVSQTSSTAAQQGALSALLTYGAAFPVGTDVRMSPLMGAILFGPSELDSTGAAISPAADGSAKTPGLLEVSPLYIGTAPAPATSTSIVITGRQIATFDSSRCTITATSETP